MFERKERLTSSNILKYITSWDIIKSYVPEATLSKSFFSPYRAESKPSTSIKMGNNGLLIKDFGSVFPATNCFGLVCNKFNLPYNLALEKVRRDFNLTQIESVGGALEKSLVQRNGNYNVPLSIKKTILVKYKNWEEADKIYWYNNYNINKSTLKLFGVSPITNFWINGDLYYTDKNCYVYYYFKADDGRHLVKIYQPYNKYFKWISNSGNLQIIQGEGMLPQNGELLIVTKSLKDIMVLYELGFTAISPPTESAFLNNKYFEKQKLRFKKIVILYDNDVPGLEAASKFSEQFNTPYIYIPTFYFHEYSIKDVSDFIKKYKYEETKKLINTLLYG